MTDDELVQLLSTQAYFTNLPRDHLKLITPCAREVWYAAGEYLFRQDQRANCFYILLEGEVTLSVRDHRSGAAHIQTVVAGEPLGWSWLTPPFRWRFDGKTRTPVRAVVFQAACLRELMDQHFLLGYELLKRAMDIMARRLQATRRQLLNVYGERPCSTEPHDPDP